MMKAKYIKIQLSLKISQVNNYLLQMDQIQVEKLHLAKKMMNQTHNYRKIIVN